jgi:hypothetical protein
MGAYRHLLLLARVKIEKPQLQHIGLILNGYHQLAPRPKQYLAAYYPALRLNRAK